MAMEDNIVNTMQAGYAVIWEEIARDGAQAQILLSANDRIQIAKLFGSIFGNDGVDHVVFAAGYPSIGKQEYEIVTQVASEVENCSLATHGRMLKQDVDLGIQTMRQAAHGRVSFAVPISEQYSQIMLHQTAQKTMSQAIDLARYALDKANGMPVDVGFGGAMGTSPHFLAESINSLFQEGIATVKLADTLGNFYPLQLQKIFDELLQVYPENTPRIGVHFHNDLGFSLANNMVVMQQGVRMISTSWLGLSERAGLAPTEQLLFALSYPGDNLFQYTQIPSPVWKTPPQLHKITEIAQFISQQVGFPLRCIDPIVSPNINDIATGAYFNKVEAFKPYDPWKKLGVPPRLVLTHLANKKIVKQMALDMGFSLDDAQTKATMAWVKEYAYQNTVSKIPTAEFVKYIKSIKPEAKEIVKNDSQNCIL